MRSLRSFQIVVAATADGLGIGKDGVLPWKLPGDMAYFKQITTQTKAEGKRNAVVMGRRTWESIPEKFRPLKGRLNIVLSRSAGGDTQQEADVQYFRSLQEALAYLNEPQQLSKIESVFVIGGGQVYREAVDLDSCTAIHITEVQAQFECDTYFPPISPERFRLWSASRPCRDGDVTYSFLCYTRKDSGPETVDLLPSIASRHEEYQYLDLTRDLIDHGVFRPDRTGTGTYSKFGCQMRFNLRHTFPLLTTKRVFWRGVVEELLWFISGSTSAKVLQDKNIHIWDGNSSREYLDSIGLTHREEGDLGPVYGFQWRHFGAQYKDMHTDYTGQGIDQLADLIHRIKTNPYDRRLLLTAWNPAALKEMALPPCHLLCQFYVANEELSCMLYQRSCDVGLGVPFNIASYSLLTLMIAQVCGLRPGEFVHTLGDAHVYANHVKPLKEQLKNVPRHLPVVKLNPNKMDIDDFTAEDFELIGYNPHKKIDMKMAV